MAQVDTDKGIDVRRAIAVEKLALGYTNQAAAEAAEVSRSSIQRWLREPQFVDALNEEVRMRMGTSSRKLNVAFDAAINTWLAIMADPHSTRFEKLRASELAASNAAAFRESMEQREQLRRLEEALGIAQEYDLL